MYEFGQLGGYRSSDEEPPEKKKPVPAPRFSPKIIAAIRGKPLPEETPDHTVYVSRMTKDKDYVPKPKPKPQKKQKKEPMQNFTIDATVPEVREAGSAPEGILHTKDYDQFVLLATNRKVDKKHVKKLVAAIRKKNLLNLNPILVNSRMEVIEGQHRLEAAKELGVAIYYVQDDEVSQDDIAALNSNKKNWQMMDYIRFYAEKGDQDYIDFLELSKANPKILPSILITLCGTDGSRQRSGFKDGRLDISNITKAHEAIGYLKDFEAHYKGCYGSRFVEALTFMMKTGEYDHQRMMQALNSNPGSVTAQANMRQYIQLLQGLYNKRVHEKNIVIFLKR